MTPEFVTIGVYGWNEDRFCEVLQALSVDTLVDVRRRRGVRGAAYAFANSRRLQAGLAQLGIRYIHRLDLAPSQAARQRQEAADKTGKTAKRLRVVLDPAFVEVYQQECLASFDSLQFLDDLGPEARVVALLCVETQSAACHRSLLAGRLEQDLGVRVRHLMP